ncbi:MAG: glutamate-cysteine ligase family protein [Micromonosporaceae bacterium]
MALVTAVRRLFAPGNGSRRVGAEIELIAVTDEARPRTVPPELIAAGFDPGFVDAALPSFEPGGQLELSPPPQPSAGQLIREVDRLVARATAIAAVRGVRLEGVGVNPYHRCDEVPLRTTTPRYLAMQRAFDEVGPQGRRMMRLTASLQITVDLLPGRAGQEQWLVANLAGPALAAGFANSPWLEGWPAGIPGARTRIWHGADLRRTGYDGRHLDLADPIGGYAAFAAAAPRLAIPEAADPAYHLTTLFPPVRPRGGCLELRYLDAQPAERIGEAITTVSTLLLDDRVRREALELLLPVAGDLEGAWLAAADGWSPYTAPLLSIVAGGLPEPPPHREIVPVGPGATHRGLRRVPGTG